MQLRLGAASVSFPCRKRGIGAEVEPAWVVHTAEGESTPRGRGAERTRTRSPCDLEAMNRGERSSCSKAL
jgi:hypothetical protein